VRDLQGIFVELRDLMDELEAVEVSRVTSMGQFGPEDHERLSNAQSIVEKALGVLEGEIDRLVAVK
jgi:phage-related minor tail protein